MGDSYGAPTPFAPATEPAGARSGNPATAVLHYAVLNMYYTTVLHYSYFMLN